MKKTIYCLISILSIIFFVLFIDTKVSCLAFKNEHHLIENNNTIYLYKNNILIKEFKNSKFMDIDDKYLLYNEENSIYLYDLNYDTSKLISDSAYNALLKDEFVIFESDFDSSKLCKNVVGTVTYRNCFKLYLYNIKKMDTKNIILNGNDNYLNDIEGDFLIYTSIHNKDDICSSLCSYINIYNFNTEGNKVLSYYDQISLDMSGNALIDNGIVYLETVPSVYGCLYTQILSYEIASESFSWVTKTFDSCFTNNSEIVYASDMYLIFKSKFNNYDTNQNQNYIYSYLDNKFKLIDNNCIHNNIIINDDKSVYCQYENDLFSFPIDNMAPTIDTNKEYVALKENNEKFLSQIECDDDLSSNENIIIRLLNELNMVGEQYINVEVCDKFYNCSINQVLVNIIDEDIEPPQIYCDNSITIKSNEVLQIEKYGFAIDNVDGKLKIELNTNIDYKKTGKSIILVKSEDSSGNVAYKEIELVIYDDFKITLIYLVFIIISIISIIIIYILRFKKHIQF